MGTAVDGTLLPKAMAGMLAAVRTQSQQRLVGGPTSRPTGRLSHGGSGAGMAGGALASAFGPASRMSGGGGVGGAGLGGGAVPAAGAGAGRGAKRPLDTLVGASALLGMTKGSGRGVASGDDDEDDEDYEAEGNKRRRMPSVPSGGGGGSGGGGAGAGAAAGGGGSWSLQRPPPRNTRLPAEKLPTCIADLPQQVRRP